MSGLYQKNIYESKHCSTCTAVTLKLLYLGYITTCYCKVCAHERSLEGLQLLCQLLATIIQIQLIPNYSSQTKELSRQLTNRTPILMVTIIIIINIGFLFV